MEGGHETHLIKTKIKSVVWCEQKGALARSAALVRAVSRTEPTKNEIKTGKRDIDALKKTKIKSGGGNIKVQMKSYLNKYKG